MARSGYHTNSTVSVFTFSNRVNLTVAAYCAGVEAAHPAAFLALCDGDTQPGCSNKRVSKSVSKTIDFTDDCLRFREESPTLSQVEKRLIEILCLTMGVLGCSDRCRGGRVGPEGTR